MACPDKICDNSAVVVTIDGNLGLFEFREYVNSGALVVFGATEHEKNIQRSNTGGKMRVTGNNYLTEEITLNLFPSDPAFDAFYKAYAANPIRACFGSVVVNDPCRGISTFRDVFVESVDPPDITNDDAQTSVVLRGIVDQTP